MRLIKRNNYKYLKKINKYLKEKINKTYLKKKYHQENKIYYIQKKKKIKQKFKQKFKQRIKILINSENKIEIKFYMKH